ncbi:NADH kinase [Silene latifolia]|uniref:NADH kinase n=1 Tax=Silene latifolia TaxID=37657 RepID=UPI003D780F52
MRLTLLRSAVTTTFSTAIPKGVRMFSFHGDPASMAAKRRLLLLLKPFNAYPLHNSHGFSKITNPKILRHFDDRIQVHKDAVKYCQDILRRKMVDCETLFYNELSRPIKDVDLVITIGGDGTLLQASHFMDDTIPVLGVNSDPTQIEEVEQFKDEFDATRSAGYLCAATTKNFERVLDGILDERTVASEISRISIKLNSQLLPTHALNDVLIAHPCPASLSRFSFRNDGQPDGSLINCRSSGLRVSTAAGSTAAMLSAGGFAMHILSKDLQYMVREPMQPTPANLSSMHGLLKSNQTMEIHWSTKEGAIYIDGCQIAQPIKLGDFIALSTQASVLKIFLPPNVLPVKGPAKL